MPRIEINKLVTKVSSSIKARDLSVKGEFPVYGAQGIAGYSKSFQTPVRSIAIIKDGAGVGRVQIIPQNSSVIGTLQLLIPKTDVDVSYLFYLFSSMDLGKSFSGATIPHIYFKDYGQTCVNDNSYASQKEIGVTLDLISNAIESSKQFIFSLDELIKSRFNELRDRERKTNTFGTFASIYSAKKCGNAKYPILSITKDNGIVFQDEKFKKRIASIDTKNYKIVPKGIFVQGIHIDEKNFDIQCIADNGIVSPAYKLWRINENICVPLVVAYAMRTDFVASYIKDKSSGSVDRRENLSNEEMKCIPLNLPSILAQKEFFKFKEQVDKLKFNAQKRIDLFQELLNKKMDEYFN